MNSKLSKRTNYLIFILLAAITLAVYWQVGGFGFITLDDPVYAQNPHVLRGLTPRSMSWALTTMTQANWHPLTWMSLMVDASLGGGKPGVFHVTNVVFHLLNTLLLFVLLNRLTGCRWRSAAVASLFAIHPLHVESVAWVTERKDVLSTLFWLLTMLAYVTYVKNPALKRYCFVVLFFALGLMAKPMLVSLPFVLLLMDLWPLGRAGVERSWWLLVREKIPLFVMSAASCVVTYLAQSRGGAMESKVLPFGVRGANALVAYVSYIIKMVCPLNLAVVYPHPGTSLPIWQTVGSALILGALLMVAIKSARNRPYIIVGWLWYMVTLVPVIGLVQVGGQAMADRYTYVPLIGLFIILAWGVPELLAKLEPSESRQGKVSPLWLALGSVMLLGLMACTYIQVGYWRTNMSLYRHALYLDSSNQLAHLFMGDALILDRDYTGAIEEYETTLRLDPKQDIAHFKEARLLQILGKPKEAAAHFQAALALSNNNPDYHKDYGLFLLNMGRVDEAIDQFTEALEIRPEDTNTRNNLGCAYAREGDLDRAIDEFRTAVEMEPRNKNARNNLARSTADRARLLGSRN